MNVSTHNVQNIRQGNKLMFAVIPSDEYLTLAKSGSADDALIPHVVELVVRNNWNLLKAWRKDLGMNQQELAAKAGISQPVFSQMATRGIIPSLHIRLPWPDFRQGIFLPLAAMTMMESAALKKEKDVQRLCKLPCKRKQRRGKRQLYSLFWPECVIDEIAPAWTAQQVRVIPPVPKQ